MTVTSCDADTLFHPRYFSALTYYFATNPKRYRTFWQGPIFYYNNVWDVPAPLRIQNSLGGINHLAKLMRKYTVLFPQSTYSLSMRMCHDVGYWDVDVVPEDWHMFLKCFFELGGEPDVQPILLPVGNDGVRAVSYKRTFWEHYQQARRHAWGCSDIPYAIKPVLRPPGDPVPAQAAPHVEPHREPRAVVVAVVPDHRRRGEHVGRAAGAAGSVGLHPFAQHNIPTWFITASHWILMPCMIPLVDDDRARHDDAPGAAEALEGVAVPGAVRAVDADGADHAVLHRDARPRRADPPRPGPPAGVQGDGEGVGVRVRSSVALDTRL